MITRREICLVILFIAVASLSASQCPTNEACYCQSSQDGVLEINCLTRNNSGFYVKIKPSQYIKITCTNSPKWSDFHLDVASLIKNDVKSMFFHTCDLPGNGSLGEITRMLGASNVEKLIFQSYKNLSSTLEKHHLDGFENLKELILSSNNMSYVDKDLLADLSNLTGLNLRENNLHLVKGFFDYTPELHWLELGENDLQSIEPGTFHNLKNLTYLNLWRNHLTELKPGVFDELVALKTLDINTNYLVSLPEDVFAKLENLNVINLSRNNFTEYLPRYLLQNNTKIHNITLQNNLRNMTTLPNGFFANLTKLESLKLMRNGFITLPKDLLWGSSSLTYLNLNRNYLKSLPPLIFRDSKELIELELNFNDLERLPDDIFVNTNRLKILDLSKNHITSISGHLFNGLYALEELKMEQNNLVTISNQACNYLTNLKIVKFSYNHLTLQSTSLEDIIDEYGKKSPFHNCFAIEELHLANNNISEIFSDWIFSNLKLRILDLKYNNIPFITAEDLQFVSNNIRVDLTHNKIQHIVLHNAEQIATYQEIPRNRIILVEDNPLECDCELYSLLCYLEGRMHPSVQNYFHIIPGNLTCRSPDKSEIIQVTDLKSRLLTCKITDIGNFTCPEKCDCYLKPEGNAFLFDYSHKNLTSVPSDIKNPGHSLQLELNFSNNRLPQMPDLKKLKLEPVKKLILSHNNISEVFLNGLSETIQVLELHDNNLSRMRPNVLEFLKNCENLTRLTLHKNPWACDCEAKDFLNFIQTKFVTIFDRRNVTCHGTNSSISEMTLVDFCPFDKTMIISISIAISLMGLLIGTFGLLYYKYQRQIKIWLFAHQLCLWFVTEEELDKDKEFDAFVSYSQKDHDFVVNELVPKLENGPTPFKLCLHYRNWEIGEWIPVNIANSVENSRRTIVVLSPNFLESVWGRMEFRAAHCQALNEGRARVILILYGDIGPTDPNIPILDIPNLDPELKAYISMNTYVKWGDPWFWDKLRYALPHQSKHAKTSIAGKKIFENHQLYIQANGDKKELIYPIETPLSTTPPADSLKLFICDKNPEEQLPLNESSQELCKLNDNVAIILTPEQLLKNNPIDNRECMA